MPAHYLFHLEEEGFFYGHKNSVLWLKSLIFNIMFFKSVKKVGLLLLDKIPRDHVLDWVETVIHTNWNQKDSNFFF